MNFVNLIKQSYQFSCEKMPKFALILQLSALLSVFTACSSASGGNLPSSLTLYERALNDASKIIDLNGDPLPDAAAYFEHITNDIGEITGGTLVIETVINACADLPCADTGANIGMLVITKDDTIFTITDFENFTNAGTTATLDIPDQEGAISTQNVDLGNITISDKDANIVVSYTVTATYTGTPVTDIIAKAGGIATLLPPASINIDFGDRGESDNAILSWENDVLTIVDIPNLDNNTAMGTVTTMLATPNLLPAGFSLTTASAQFSNPDGTGEDTLTVPNAFTIAEDTDVQNSVSYTLFINLLATPAVFLTAEDLSITITDTRGTPHNITSAQLQIDQFDDAPSVTITAAAGILNFNEEIAALGLNIGTADFADVPDSIISIDAAEINASFNDPTGTETETLDLGSIIAIENSASTTYTLELVLATSYNILLGTEVIPDVGTSSSSPYTTIPACTKPPSSVFTIAADSTTNFLDEVSAGIYYYYSYIDLTYNTHAPVLTAADDSVLNFLTTIAIAKCNTFADGDGTLDNPWEIDNDIRLDLMSRIVNDDSAYKDDHYVLTADIDMGIPEAPWAEDSTHPQANTNGFIPIGKTNRFSGQLDCAYNANPYAISSLYISNAGGSQLGLFGFLTNGAVIINCTLSDPKLTGYQYTGGFAGYVHVSNNTSKSVVMSSNTITGGSITTKSHYAGGIAGYVKNSNSGDDYSIVMNSNTITDVSITAKSNYAGGIAGRLIRNNSSSISLDNNSVSGGSFTAAKYAGGIAGEAYQASLSNNSLSGGSVTANYFAGGIVGQMQKSTLSDSRVSNATITVNTSSAGGIAGKTWSVNYSSSVTLSNNIVSDSTIRGTDHTGGIVGMVYNYSSSGATVTLINNIVSNNTIEAYSQDAGGIAGYVTNRKQGTINISTNTVSDTSVLASNRAGGIAGVIRNSNTDTLISSSSVTGGSITANQNKSNYAGGVVGSVYDNNSSTLIISNMFIATTVNGKINGGVMGVSRAGEITNSVFFGKLNDNSGKGTGILASNTALSKINNSYAVTKATGTSTYGLSPTGVTVSSSYYDSTLTTGANDDLTGTRAQNTSALQTPTAPPTVGSGDVYDGWDANNWDFGAAQQYPMLKGLPLTAAEQCQAADVALGDDVTLNCDVNTGSGAGYVD